MVAVVAGKQVPDSLVLLFLATVVMLDRDPSAETAWAVKVVDGVAVMDMLARRDEDALVMGRDLDVGMVMTGGRVLMAEPG